MHRKRKSAVLFRFVTFSSTQLVLFAAEVNCPSFQTTITNLVIQLHSIVIEYAYLAVEKYSFPKWPEIGGITKSGH